MPRQTHADIGKILIQTTRVHRHRFVVVKMARVVHNFQWITLWKLAICASRFSIHVDYFNWMIVCARTCRSMAFLVLNVRSVVCQGKIIFVILYILTYIGGRRSFNTVHELSINSPIKHEGLRCYFSSTNTHSNANTIIHGSRTTHLYLASLLKRN